MLAVDQFHILLIFLTCTVVRAQPLLSEPVILPVLSNEGPGSCPADDVIETTLNSIFEAVENLVLLECGGFGWRTVADIDMERESQQCPPPWVETDNPARSCRSTISMSSGGCEAVSFSVTGAPYTRVCGQIIGFGLSTPDGFIAGSEGINGAYLDGVSVTRGSPRQHIWSFGASIIPNSFCPCDNPNDRVRAPFPPSFVGDDYYCDGPHNGALWDGEDCSTDCCTFNSPPYFSVTLPSPTTDAIEVRICTSGPLPDEAINIRRLQLFVT